jgi:hypothetical protein
MGWKKSFFHPIGFFLSRGKESTMQKSLLFWILMLLWLVVGMWGFWPASGAVVHYGTVGWGLVLFVLIGLLGWKVFGAPLQG